MPSRKLSDLELELKDKHETLVHLERREEKVIPGCLLLQYFIYSSPLRLLTQKMNFGTSSVCLKKKWRRYIAPIDSHKFSVVQFYHIHLQAEARAEDAERNNARLNMTISTLESKLIVMTSEMFMDHIFHTQMIWK